jgi:hypothetical protein
MRGFVVTLGWQIRTDEGLLSRRLRAITLKSVPLFREFANDAVMDVLVSPFFW